MKRQYRNGIFAASLIALAMLGTGTSAILGRNTVLEVSAALIEVAALVLLVYNIARYRTATE